MKLFKIDGMLTFDGKDFFAESRIVAAEREADLPDILEHHRLNSYDKPEYRTVATQEIEMKTGVLARGESLYMVGTFHKPSADQGLKLFKLDGMILCHGTKFCYAETLLVAAESLEHVTPIVERYGTRLPEKIGTHKVVATNEIVLRPDVLLHGETIFTV